ncbi:unnamed protein product [Symbiodinium sp. CCMP2592]|nr:unnamed protein product [Symbiodinium sp. CCMP2592]
MGQSVGKDIAEQTGFRPAAEDGQEVPPHGLTYPDRVEESIEGPPKSPGEPLNVVVRGEVPGSLDASSSGSSVPHSLAWSGSWPVQGAPMPWPGTQAWPQLPSQFQGLGATAVTTATEAEAESQRRAAQIAALSCQVEVARSELAQLRRPSTAASIALAQQARHLITAFQPELSAVKAKLAHTTHVANELHSWFMTHRDKMSIEDPSRSPSAQLHHRLQSCEILIDGFRSVAERVEGVLEAALKDSQPAVCGSRPGPTPQGARPGGAGVPGLWVRDPDAMKTIAGSETCDSLRHSAEVSPAALAKKSSANEYRSQRWFWM